MNSQKIELYGFLFVCVYSNAIFTKKMYAPTHFWRDKTFFEGLLTRFQCKQKHLFSRYANIKVCLTWCLYTGLARPPDIFVCQTYQFLNLWPVCNLAFLSSFSFYKYYAITLIKERLVYISLDTLWMQIHLLTVHGFLKRKRIILIIFRKLWFGPRMPNVCRSCWTEKGRGVKIMDWDAYHTFIYLFILQPIRSILKLARSTIKKTEGWTVNRHRPTPMVSPMPSRLFLWIV